jgi:hypothetical protein
MLEASNVIFFYSCVNTYYFISFLYLHYTYDKVLGPCSLREPYNPRQMHRSSPGWHKRIPTNMVVWSNICWIRVDGLTGSVVMKSFKTLGYTLPKGCTFEIKLDWKPGDDNSITKLPSCTMTTYTRNFIWQEWATTVFFLLLILWFIRLADITDHRKWYFFIL